MSPPPSSPQQEVPTMVDMPVVRDINSCWLVYITVWYRMVRRKMRIL